MNDITEDFWKLTEEVKRLREEKDKLVKTLEEDNKILKKIVLSLEDDWNCPNSHLEKITGISWMQYHDLRRRLEEEE